MPQSDVVRRVETRMRHYFLGSVLLGATALLAVGELQEALGAIGRIRPRQVGPGGQARIGDEMLDARRIGGFKQSQTDGHGEGLPQAECGIPPSSPTPPT